MGMAMHSYRLEWITSLFLLISLGRVASAQTPLKFDDPNPKRYEVSARASQIDSRAKQHPEIDFVFTKDGRPSDLERASVDTRLAPQGKLVIWLMGYNPALFERINGYGL